MGSFAIRISALLGQKPTTANSNRVIYYQSTSCSRFSLPFGKIVVHLLRVDSWALQLPLSLLAELLQSLSTRFPVTINSSP